MRVQLEQVVAEQTIYSIAALLPTSVVRQPLEQLLPVRWATLGGEMPKPSWSRASSGFRPYKDEPLNSRPWKNSARK